MAPRQRPPRPSRAIAGFALIGVAVGVLLTVSLLGPGTAPSKVHAGADQRQIGLPHPLPPTQTRPALADPEFLPTTLVDNSPANFGRFGRGVAVSGSVVVIGGPGDLGGYGDVLVRNLTSGTTIELLGPEGGDDFGLSVALGGGRVVVGAPDYSADAGAVFVYNASTGYLISTYVSPNAQTDPPSPGGGLFGASVATSGSWIVVGAEQENVSGVAFAGLAYVINAQTGAMRSLASPDPQYGGDFGESVAISGNLVVVGAPDETPIGSTFPYSGAAYVFSAVTGDLITNLSSTDPASPGAFGWAVGISGEIVVVGAPDETDGGFEAAGNVHVFDLTTGTNSTLSTPNPIGGGAFGASVAVDPMTILAGAPAEESTTGVPGSGNAYIYSTVDSGLISSALAPPNWPEDAEFGVSVAESGSEAVVGAPFETALSLSNAGQAFVFNQIPLTVESPNPYLAGDGGYFGNSVSVNGGVVAIGAPDQQVGDEVSAGNAYLVRGYSGPIQTFASPNPQPDGEFGFAVSLQGTALVVGAPDESSGAPESGDAYIFNTTTGSVTATLSSPNAVEDGGFGAAVAIGGSWVVVGAPYENGAGGSLQGNAYVFNAASGALVATLTSPNAQTDGTFGFSVAISGSTVVVGAYGEDGYVGEAYVFKASTGALLRDLVNPDDESSAFGYSVATNGATAVVGAPGANAGVLEDAGAAFTFSTTTGGLLASLATPNPTAYGLFGWSVAANGATIVVGAPEETAWGVSDTGNAYLFNAASGALADRYNNPVPSNDGFFGGAVGIGPAGLIAVGAPDTFEGGYETGSAFIFFL